MLNDEMRDVPITEAMLKATREPVERAVTFDNIEGLVFLQIQNGNWRIHSTQLSQTLHGSNEFNDIVYAVHFAKRRLCSPGRVVR